MLNFYFTTKYCLCCFLKLFLVFVRNTLFNFRLCLMNFRVYCFIKIKKNLELKLLKKKFIYMNLCKETCKVAHCINFCAYKIFRKCKNILQNMQKIYYKYFNQLRFNKEEMKRLV